MPRTTITDVARRAKVSESTVSRVLSGNSVYMRPETREMVLCAIEALNYRPSSLARSLVSKRTCTVGPLISDVSNPFYAEVIHGVESVALDRGYAIYLFNTGYDLARGLAFADVLIDKHVDGVILMSSSLVVHRLAAAVQDRRHMYADAFGYAASPGRKRQGAADQACGIVIPCQKVYRGAAFPGRLVPKSSFAPQRRRRLARRVLLEISLRPRRLGGERGFFQLS